jgi:thiosulfate dehydrogenase [quinone] large subunit
MSTIDEFRTSKAIRHWPLVLLRVYTGVYFLYYGFGKLRRDNFADGMVSFLNSQLESSFGIYRPFLESVVLPNYSLFAFLVAWGEFAVGIALILGLATRYAAIVGAFLVVNFWFAKGQGLLDAQNHDVIWLIIFIVLAGLHAGRVMSVDQRLVGRFRFLA